LFFCPIEKAIGLFILNNPLKNILFSDRTFLSYIHTNKILTKKCKRLRKKCGTIRAIIFTQIKRK